MSESGDLRDNLQKIATMRPLSSRECKLMAMIMPNWAWEDVSRDQDWYGKEAVEVFEDIMGMGPINDPI